MPTSTFWNQVRLLTPNLEPLITLTPDRFPVPVCWPWHWTPPAEVWPDATLLLETPPLALVRTPLPWRLEAWQSPVVPGGLILVPRLTDPYATELPDDRIWAACMEVLAGTGHQRVILLEEGRGLVPALADAPWVQVGDHINWTRDNYLMGYPVEDDTPTRFIDTQHLYAPLPELPSAVACLTSLPALQTPAEQELARRLGGEVLTGTVGLLALLAHFKRLRVSVVLRLQPAAGFTTCWWPASDVS
ncbi:MAG: hypothetical protein GEEBNDBF_01266 [bacterium]|nr:hypothetical protein [bacterium]